MAAVLDSLPAETGVHAFEQRAHAPLARVGDRSGAVAIKQDLLVFRADRPTPAFVQYLGRVLPMAVFGMLIVYCLKNVTPFAGSHGLPELIAICVVAALHLWKHQMLLSIAGGTVCYMLLVQFVFR